MRTLPQGHACVWNVCRFQALFWTRDVAMATATAWTESHSQQVDSGAVNLKDVAPHATAYAPVSDFIDYYVCGPWRLLGRRIFVLICCSLVVCGFFSLEKLSFVVHWDARLPSAPDVSGSNRAADKKVSVFITENLCDTQLWARAAHWLQCLGRLSLPPYEGR